MIYHFIVNPASRSGRGEKIWNDLLPAIQQTALDYDVYFTKGKGDAAPYVRHLEANFKRFSKDCLNSEETTLTNVANRLIVLGGDGTINEVIQGITDCSTTYLAYIPIGSSNDLARDLYPNRKKLSPCQQLTHILSHPETVAMDLGRLYYHKSKSTELDNRYFAGSSGIGFDAAVCHEAMLSPLKDFWNKMGLGKLTYLTIALKQLIQAKKVSCDIFLDDAPAIHLNRFLFITAMIHRYEGGGFLFCPDANAQDGYLDLCIVADVSKAKILCVLPTAFWGKHTRFKNILNYRVKKVRIKTSSPLWLHTDGEVHMQADEVYITCEHKQIRFFGL